MSETKFVEIKKLGYIVPLNYIHRNNQYQPIYAPTEHPTVYMLHWDANTFQNSILKVVVEVCAVDIFHYLPSSCE